MGWANQTDETIVWIKADAADWHTSFITNIEYKFYWLQLKKRNRYRKEVEESNSLLKIHQLNSLNNFFKTTTTEKNSTGN